MATDIRNGRRGRGLSLIEAALALGLAAVAMAALMQVMGDGAAQVRARATADRLAQVVAATRDYVRVHHNQLVAAAGPGAPLVVPVGRASTGAPVPSGPSGLPSLQGGGFLPSTYVDVNPYGQRHAVLVREMAPNRLEVMVTTHGGRAIRDADLGRIASRVGAEGGFMMTSPPGGVTGEIQGAFGGWRTMAAAWANGTAGPATGHVMAMLGFDNGTVLTDFLYRYDIGVPEANRMHAMIDMNGNDLDNVAALRGAAGVLRIGQDAEIERDIRAGGDVSAAGNVGAGGDLTADRDISADRDVSAGRDLSASGVVTGGQGLLTNRSASPGAPCPTVGLIGRDASGRAYSCVGGVWSAVGSLHLGMPIEGAPLSTSCNGVSVPLTAITVANGKMAALYDREVYSICAGGSWQTGWYSTRYRRTHDGTSFSPCSVTTANLCQGNYGE